MKKAINLSFTGKCLGSTSVVMLALQIARKDTLFAFIWLCVGAVSLAFILGDILAKNEHGPVGWWSASMGAMLLSFCFATGMLFFFKEKATLFGMLMTLLAAASVSFAQVAMIWPSSSEEDTNE